MLRHIINADSRLYKQTRLCALMLFDFVKRLITMLTTKITPSKVELCFDKMLILSILQACFVDRQALFVDFPLCLGLFRDWD